jgi:hypothetical protein
MKIRCKTGGKLFNPDEETMELMTDCYISAVDVNTCDECFEMLRDLHYDTEGIISDADPGLLLKRNTQVNKWLPGGCLGILPVIHQIVAESVLKIPEIN